MQQRDGAAGRGDLQPAPRLELTEHGGVAGDLGAGITLAAQSYIDPGLAGDHDRPIGERVRADGCHDQYIESRIDDRAAAGEGIGSRAGCGGDDQAVTAVRIDITTIDACFKIQHAAGLEPIEYHVVEREALYFG